MGPTPEANGDRAEDDDRAAGPPGALDSLKAFDAADAAGSRRGVHVDPRVLRKIAPPGGAGARSATRGGRVKGIAQRAGAINPTIGADHTADGSAHGRKQQT